MMINAPRGTMDILPKDSRVWRYVEGVFADVCDAFGYGELRLPIFEHSELYLRGVGETTDIVQKEMYTFSDRGLRSLTLRPEGTAGVVRAFLENKLQNEPLPAKLYYNGPMFRYERPEAGRFRQFSQLGIEAIGSHDPAMDAEIIALTMEFYRRLGIEKADLVINSVGCSKCRPLHRRALIDSLSSRRQELCTDCQNRLEKNPLRLFDCKNEHCQEILAAAPRITDYLCDDCRQHLETLQAYLQAYGLAYRIDTNLVRGLDYYTRTVFEVYYPDRSVLSSAIGAGGRYNGLVEELGGSALPGVGVALGVDRAIMVLQAAKTNPVVQPPLQVFFAAIGQAAHLLATELMAELRKNGIYCDQDYLNRGLKAQMKYADKLGAKNVAILGEEELSRGIFVLRDMATKEQTEMSKAELLTRFLAKQEK
ncbi:MAG: histidine--tRNA ligase [Negativicutes bacterium]|nr:histidine--tRNA ligase [Negativicutes bacterium]